MKIAVPARFEEMAASLQAPLEVVSKPLTGTDYANLLKKWRPELVLVLGWYQIIPPEILAMAPLGFVGIHASLLPKYRGMAPVNWAIINGETETGISLFYLAKGVDDGDIIDQKKIPIADSDTCATLYDRVASESVLMLKEYLPRIASGTAGRTAQDHSRATVMPRRRPEDGRIDWSWRAKRVYDFVRAQTSPYPGAFTFLNGRKLYVWSCSVTPEPSPQSSQPGNLRACDGRICATCGEGKVVLHDVQWADEDRAAPASELLASAATDKQRFEVAK